MSSRLTAALLGVVVLGALIATPFTASASPTTTWTQQFPATSAAAREWASTAYDPATGNMVLFGGNNGGYFGDTWTYDATTWTHQSPAASRSARYGASNGLRPGDRQDGPLWRHER